METVTSKQVIESVVEAAKVTIAYGYDDHMYVKPPPADMQVAISYLLAPLLMDIIMDCNNFILSEGKSPEAATTFKQTVNTRIDKWLSNMETATEFAAKHLQ
mgnify:CR=1 FL=1